jgi:hypothetical protein
VCLWLGCGSGVPENSRTWDTEGTATVVGRQQDTRVLALEEPHVTAARPFAEERERAIEAWRRAPGSDSALGLARTYFPEFSDSTQEDPRKAPVNPVAALRVKLPATEGGAMELATRGAVFTVRQEAGATPASGHGTGATFYGDRHFWTAVGEHVVQESGVWLTQRVEEYVVMEGGAQPFRARYEITVPDGVKAVKDAGDYLEFLDGREVPLLRLHYAVGRDSMGLSRQGTVRLWGVAAEPATPQGCRTCFALTGRTLRVEMEVGLEGMQGPVVVDPGWSSTGTMGTVRFYHTATLLPSGQVLVTGGRGFSNSYFASAEVYDPGTGTWAATGSMASARHVHTATLLPSGRVLIAGGHSGSRSLASAEVYDPSTGTWASTGSMASARWEHTATLLSGRVLVVGGSAGSSALSSAEVYEPSTGTWASTGSLIWGRSAHTATLLPSGKLLVTGGSDGINSLSSAELYDPGTGAWDHTGFMVTIRAYHTATLLPSGKLLVTGGRTSNGGALQRAEVYDPGQGTWAATSLMASNRFLHTATLLDSGKVLIVGGYNGGPVNSPEVYDPGSGTWAATSPMASARYAHTATLLHSGKLLVAGGHNSVTPLASVEVYDAGPPPPVVVTPANGAVVNTATPAISGTAEAHTTVTVFFDGSVAGTTGANASGNWSFTPSSPLAQGTHVVTAQATNAAGDTSRVSAFHSFTVDTVAPSAPVVVTPANGAFVNTARPVISGTAEAHSTVTVSFDGAVAGTVLASGSGNWSFTPPTALAPGPHSVTAQSRDAAGNTSRPSSSSSFTVDTAAPAAPVVAAPASGAFVNTARPVISGTAEAHSTVTVSFDGTVAGMVAATPSGVWSFTPSSTLAEGLHSVTARATDAAGNASPASSPGSFTVDTVPPAAPVVATPARNATVTTATPTISGTAEATTMVTISFDGTVAGTALASGSGSWSFMPTTALEQGLHAVLAQAKDAAGNTSISTSNFFTVDTVAPAAPVVVTPANGAVVNTATPTISGTSEADSTVTVSFDGTVAGTVAVNNSGSWSFTPSTALAEGLHAVTVSAADPAGNTSPTSTSRSFSVDTVAPSAPAVQAPAHGAFVSTTPVISGTAEADSTVTVCFDGTVAGTAVVNGSGSWSFTPSTALAQGLHSVTARSTDAAGNISPASLPRSFTVDTVPPTVPEVQTPASGAVISTTTPVISGTAEADSTVTVSVNGTVVGTTLANGSGSWSFTLSTALVEGPHSVLARATDAAGNTSPSSSARSFTVDTVAPAAPVVMAPANGAIINTATPVISGTAEAHSEVIISVDGVVAGTTLANGLRNWSFTVTTALSQGAHSGTAQATDAAGNTGPASSAHPFTVDTIGPTAPVVLTPVNGARVSTSTPDISGRAEANATVTISFDGTVAGTAVANGSGNWSFPPSTALAEGIHSVTAQATDAAGNISPPSSAHAFTVDTVAPAAPVVVTPANGAQVNTTTPAISGTAEAHSTVSVSIDEVVAGTTIADGSGNWSFTPGRALAQGLHSASAQATDAAGNTGPVSNSRSFTVDTITPTVPVVLTPASGAMVNTPTPVISGTAEANSTVAVSIDGMVAGTALADGLGNWSFTPTTTLAQGLHSASAQVTDAAGNTGPVSNSRSFTVDTMAPAVPGVVTPASDALVTTTMPVISGTAEAHTTVVVSIDGTVAGTVVVDGTGSWSLTPSTALAQGFHSVTAQVTDAAGNTSTVSNTRSFIVDSQAPTAPGVLTPATGALTNTTTPVISGTAEAYGTVTVFLDGTVAGTVVTDGSGTWSLTPAIPLPQGPYTVTAHVTDAAGNTSPASSPHSFTVDTEAPASPVLTAIPALITTAKPTIAGTAEPGSIVTVSLDEQVAGTATASTTGAWSFTPESSLGEGPHTLTATSTDGAGNTSLVSSPTPFAVDTIAPAAPVVNSPTADTVTELRKPTITGTADVGTKVKVLLDDVEVGTEVVLDTGTWSFTPAEFIPLGSHTLAAISMDTAGNQSPASVPTSFTVSTRGHYGGCATVPTSPVSWVAVVLGIGWLRRRRREQHVHPPRKRGSIALALLCLGSLLGGEALGETPPPLKSGPPSSSLGFMIGLHSEVELLKRGFTPALTAELSNVRLGAVLTAVFRPMGVRAEGRLYPYDLGRVRPYLTLGATYLPNSHGLGGRAGLGVALQLGSLQLFTDAAYERFSSRGDTYYYEPKAVLVSLGVGWSFLGGRPR